MGAVSSTQVAGCIVGYANTVTVENCNYVNTCDAGGEGTPLDIDYMRSQEYVDYLNGLNRDPIWARDVEYINDGFPILVEDNLAVQEHAEHVKIYPNPAQGQFIVEGTGRMRVMNLLGQTVLNRFIEGQTTVELPRGMYFISIGVATQKVVVE